MKAIKHKMKTIKQKYKILLEITIGIILINQVFTQVLLYQKRNDAHTINIGGKQRTLSQRVYVEASRMYRLDEPESELRSIFQEWKSNHYSLLGSASKNRLTIENETVLKSLNELSGQITFAEKIINSTEDITPKDLTDLYNNQKIFLTEMNENVKILELAARKRLNNIVILEIILMLISMILIIIRVRLVFKPTLKLLENQKEHLTEQKAELLEQKESNEHLSKFANIVTHDLKVPIRGINGFSHLLKRVLSKKEQTKKEQEYLDFIISSTHKMVKLIDDISTFVKVGDSPLKLTKIDLHETITLLLDEFKEGVSIKKGEIITKNLPLEIVADETKLMRVFQNLISNAIKYSKLNIPPIIIISSTESDRYWHFSVQDNGIGIEKEYHEKIFNMFFKLNTNPAIESNGIGLGLVKSAIEKHEGVIECSSTVGEGTIFTFTIAKQLNEIME